MPASVSDYADLALAVYVEELAAEKRVLFVGDSSSRAADRLAEVARTVDVVTPRARARGTRRGGRVQNRRWPGEEDEGRWDLVIVPDLLGAGASDLEHLGGMSRWLAPDGVFVAGAKVGPTDDGEELGYQQLYDLLESSFESVRMIGQAPFFGWSVVDFAPIGGALDVTFDGSLLEGSGQKPQRYLALCGDVDVVLDAYAVVQVPGREDSPEERPSLPAPADERQLADLTKQVREQQDAIDAANVHAEELEQALDDARAGLEKSREELGAAREKAKESKRRADSLRRDLESVSGGASDDEYVQLESALFERAREVSDLRAEVERRGLLARDLVEELRERDRGVTRPMLGVIETLPAPSPSPPADLVDTPPTGVDVDAISDPADETIEIELGPVERALHAQVSAAAERAVSLEAEKAELQFRLDEVRGELAIAEAKFAQDNEELRRLEAALRGTVRGLNARIAETVELYQLSQARCALAEDDTRTAERRNHELSREVAEVREQLELEMSRVRALESRNTLDVDGAALDELAKLRATDAVAAAREGELSGEIARSQAALEEATAAAARVRSELEAAHRRERELQSLLDDSSASYERRIAELTTQLSDLGSDTERALIEASELKTRLEVSDRTDAALQGEIAGLRMRLLDREAALVAFTAANTIPPDRRRGGRRAEDQEPSIEDVTAERDAARDELEALNTTLEELRVSAEAASRAVEERDAIAAERDDARRRLEELNTTLEELRASAEAASRVAEERDAIAAERDQARRELDEMITKLRDMESEAASQSSADSEALTAERDEARRALEAARDALEQANARAEQASAPLEELRRSLEEREGLVARLQTQLAHAADTKREIERRLSQTQSELGARDEALASASVVADVKVEEGERELDQLREELAAAKAHGEQAEDALEEAREILAQLEEDLPDPDAEDEGPSDMGEMIRLRDRLKELSAEANDRDVLMRSLTAQLQERGDRIRALERMVEGGVEGDEAELSARLLEMEERVARLTEELEHERARR